jgi:hypothetical protein
LSPTHPIELKVHLLSPTHPIELKVHLLGKIRKVILGSSAVRIQFYHFLNIFVRMVGMQLLYTLVV